ncbi:MAG: hypothetical protein AW07_03544 [Candidatus Accumulibacter sp. SK-11]|nr:MAG: hypothetical protein AW07_03544 [Candidatus Accumulibacter sp. SK-11]
MRSVSVQVPARRAASGAGTLSGRAGDLYCARLRPETATQPGEPSGHTET